MEYNKNSHLVEQRLYQRFCVYKYEHHIQGVVEN